MFSSIEVFSKGKNPTRNEDFHGSNDNTIIVADGSTDKSGGSYIFDGKEMTGGEIVSRLIVSICLEADLTGIELSKTLNSRIHDCYKELAPRALQETIFRFSAFFVCAKIIASNLVITQIGDVSYRVNGVELHEDYKEIDLANAKLRAEYIKKHPDDVEGGRKEILKNLKQQFEYQNNPTHQFGYGAIDGTSTPEKFIRVQVLPLNDVQILEIWSDGYFRVADESTIESWEKSYKIVENEDPDKYLRYLSTKSSDDRTILIARMFSAR